MDDALKFRIAIGLVKGVGNVLARNLIAYLGSVEAVFQQNLRSLSKVPGIGPAVATAILEAGVMERAEAEVAFVNQHRLQTLFFLDEAYPVRLQQCEDAPLLLYAKGNVEWNSAKIISIVGTRQPSDFGKEFCARLVADLAGLFPDLVVVSGMAYGIDICAHRQALKSGLSTVGVLAHGLDMLYPPMHRDTAVQMTTQGALLTEFMSKSRPDKQNFVKRNRIVAGLSDATLVVESGIKGGALITADLAVSYNRDVLAVPNAPGFGPAAGCNYLIKKNLAALVESAGDVAEALGWEQQVGEKAAVQKKLFPVFSGDEARNIYELLQREGDLTSSVISVKTNIPVSRVNALMLTLEFDGWVKALPGNLFHLI